MKSHADRLLAKGQVSDAASLYEQILGIDKNDVESLISLADLQIRIGQFDSACINSARAIHLSPSSARAFLVSGIAQFRMGRKEDAQNSIQRAIQLKPDWALPYAVLGDHCREQGNFDAAENYYRHAVHLKPGDALVQYNFGNMLGLQGRYEEAWETYQTAMMHEPGLAEAYWKCLKLLPQIYETQKQVGVARERFTRGLEELQNSLCLDSPEGRRFALRGALAGTNFFLQYQGLDDRVLQALYARILEAVVTAVFPQWRVPLERPIARQDVRIRVGYASAFLRAHNGAVWLLGWLQHRDEGKFEIFGYHTGLIADAKTEEFRHRCDHFVHIPKNIQKVCERIRQDRLDILVYPELGMDAQTMLMAALRLAPVQCAGWGHPVTTGLTTVDYWISSDLMEPENAQEHYTETLVRLPNLGNCYSIAQHDDLQKSGPGRLRKDFGLKESSVVYLCNQSLFKYLPRYDYLIPEIARRVPGSCFVFLAISSVYIVRRFMKRIEAAFNDARLEASDHCMMLPRLPPKEFLQLSMVADVFLDNPPWSGNNTALAAIDCHLPIVTLPTQFMRGRHSYAILKMLGLEELIASSEAQYIDLASRLGTDSGYRRMIREKIAKKHNRIYDDLACVKGLEKFYESVVVTQS